MRFKKIHGFQKLLLTLLLFILCSHESFQDTLKICSKFGEEQFCQQLARRGQIACQDDLHNVDCVLKIQQSITQGGLLEPEEAFLAAPLIGDDVIVLGEVFNGGRTPFQTVVVVKSDYRGGFDNLKGKKFCHPGFKHNEYVTRYILQEFENRCLGSYKYNCGSNLSLIEKHIQSVEDFFGSSCRPGLWSQDLNLDANLKSTYPSLCDLCGPQKCDVDYKTPFNDSLTCLINNDADVAVTTLENVDFLVKNFPNKYKALCKNGSVSDLEKPCTWTDQLPRLIVGSKDKVNKLKQTLEEYFKDDTQKQYLLKIWKIEQDASVVFANQFYSLLEYVRSRRTIPTLKGSEQCDVSLRWCTRNAIEQEKCKWLSQASLNEGIQPVVECIAADDETDSACLQSIAHSKSDIFAANTNFAYTAAKFGFTTLAYPETDTRYVYAVQIALGESNTAKSISDLKNQKACIPEFAGKEWFIFTSFLQDKKLVKRNPDYGKVIVNFVGDSCMPGTKESQITDLEDDAKDKLCNLCLPIYNNMTAKYCNRNFYNKYYKNSGAVKCLKDGVGDYAVLTSVESPQSTGLNKILCKNDTVINQDPATADEDCALNVIVTSEIIARQGDEHNKDYVLALREFEKVFGENIQKPFHLFDRFNETKDLLFKDSTPGIQFPESTSDIYIENLKTLISNIEKGSGNNGGNTITQTFFSLLACLCFLHAFNF